MQDAQGCALAVRQDAELKQERGLMAANGDLDKKNQRIVPPVIKLSGGTSHFQIAGQIPDYICT